MGQASSKKGDVRVRSNDNFDYNVSRFLRKHNAKASSRKRINQFNEFIQLLDAKVYINTNDPRYSHIYQGIDTIVKRVIDELIKLDPFFAHVKLRRTGSSTSGVKVGLPHESDYVLELPKDKLLRSGESFNRHNLFHWVNRIVDKCSFSLTEQLPNWTILGTKRYSKFGGICLVMECRACENNLESEKVGVTVDLVPAFIVESPDESFNEKAASFLPYSLDTYAQKGELYRLLREDDCDTGFIENNIMTQLPEEIKQPYRVAKYLLSNLHTRHEIPYSNIVTLDEETRQKLYGLKAGISSYTIRVFFLHLIFNIHGTDAEQRLQGGLLVLCLLDMIDQCVKSFKDKWTLVISLKHPLIVNREERHVLTGKAGRFVDIMMRTMAKDTPAKLVERCNLLIDFRAPISGVLLR